MLSLYESEVLLVYRMSELARERERNRLVMEALSAGRAPGMSGVRRRLMVWLGGRLVVAGRYLQARGGLSGMPTASPTITMHTLLITHLSAPKTMPGVLSMAPSSGVEGECLDSRQPAA
jgi:hypothetical protein